MSKASELSILTCAPDPINVAVTEIGNLLWLCAGSVVRSRMVLSKLIDPIVVAPAAIVMVVSTSVPFLEEPGKPSVNSKFSARVEVNS